jgi:hypothetical protein
MSGTTSSAAPDELIAALLAVAGAENAAIYGYSVAGAHLDAHDRAVARGHYDTHRAQLQAVSGWLSDRGATPSPPPAVYALPKRVTDAASASALLVQLEETTAARYADLVAVADGSLRRAAALALQGAAVRQVRWSGHCVPFPGLTGRLPS